MSQYKYLDTTAFEKYFGGIDYQKSVQLYLKIGNIFLKNLEKNMHELKASFATDPNMAKVLAHRVKGSLLSLGGNVMAAVFYELETGAGSKSADELNAFLSSKEGDLEAFIHELKQWMNHLESSSSSGQS